MFHVPIEEITKTSPLRQKGKISELALGYGGAVGALTSMGALKMGLTEEELPGLVSTWRNANPHITAFWWAVDDAAIMAVRDKKTSRVGRVSFEYKSGILFVTLPSGRKLSYVKPRMMQNKFGREGLTYEGIGESKKWMRLETYGPKLVENIVQAASRDILAEAMLRLEKEGFDIVCHVHDEVVLEVPDGKSSVEEVNEIMAVNPVWTEGLPLKAAGLKVHFIKRIRRRCEMKIAVSTGNSRMDKKWNLTEMELEDFRERISKTQRTAETMEQYRKMKKSQQDDIKDVGGFVLGRLKGGRRKKDCVISRSALTLDMDYAVADIGDQLELFFSFQCYLYSTHKHTPEKPRLRLIIPLSHEISPDEYMAVSRKVAEEIGMELFDDTTYEPSRLMYWPSTSSDGEFIFQEIKGELLKPEDVLALYTDWKDVSSWPVSIRQRIIVQKSLKKQENPLEKKRHYWGVQFGHLPFSRQLMLSFRMYISQARWQEDMITFRRILLREW